MTKVGKLDGEGTYAGTRGNDGDAPIPDLPLVRPGSLVIEANPLKYSMMAARSLALALLLLLCVTPVGWAAEPAGATVVLQLPASISPDQVKGLIADLAAKGAEPILGGPSAADDRHEVDSANMGGDKTGDACSAGAPASAAGLGPTCRGRRRHPR